MQAAGSNIALHQASILSQPFSKLGVIASKQRAHFRFMLQVGDTKNLAFENMAGNQWEDYITVEK